MSGHDKADKRWSALPPFNASEPPTPQGHFSPIAPVPCQAAVEGRNGTPSPSAVTRILDDVGGQMNVRRYKSARQFTGDLR